jgi:hopene-associated glycosyltransferase HpnB
MRWPRQGPRAKWGANWEHGAGVLVIAVIALAVWLYLLVAHGAFWRCTERDDWEPVALDRWPRVAAVVPARNEADGIAESVAALLRQDYAGPWTVIVVDDESSDGTADVARRVAAGDTRLHVVPGGSLPAGWTGKLWALKQGIDAAISASQTRVNALTALPQPPELLLLTDADIVHAPDSVSRLVAHAERKGLVLTSLMVKLRCESFAERFNVPAFIFFFQMLYPFANVNRPRSAVAAAAGGCMLVRTDALREAGGIEAIRGALIDDCALAKVLKARGPIWLGLTDRVHSIRPYPALGDIRRMVVRSAYAQLRYSPLLLMGTTAGMLLTYLVPPLLAIFGSGAARIVGGVTWLLMAIAFQPTLRFYRCSPLWGIALPVIALEYMLFTLDSAYQYVRGRGGNWKGRMQANVSEP